MEKWVVWLVIFEALLATFIIWGILNEKKLIEFERNFPENVQNYVGWHIRWIKKRFMRIKNAIENGLKVH